MSKLNVAIVGGHGKVALRLARILGPDHSVTSIVRDKAHEDDIRNASATPLVLSLEHASVEELKTAFEGKNVVYFIAGAGGKGATPEEKKERTRKIDYEGAVKVFDAIEACAGAKPRLILVSAIDVRDVDARDPSKPDEPMFPAHYTTGETDVDKEGTDTWMSRRMNGTTEKPGVLRTYMQAKYEADANLVKRDAFKWTILRPGGLTDDTGTGKASIGKTRLMPAISRDDVATALALLLKREDAAGIALDMVGGNKLVAEGLADIIEDSKKRTVTAFPVPQVPLSKLQEDNKRNSSTDK
ncbi:NADH(P)-binding-domain-containing protein [Mycena vitilis]|nr:NADH(P)-binding-domain-containing protein [Mycena vitilis]